METVRKHLNKSAEGQTFACRRYDLGGRLSNVELGIRRSHLSRELVPSLLSQQGVKYSLRSPV